jgi:hypothetical protein
MVRPPLKELSVLVLVMEVAVVAPSLRGGGSSDRVGPQRPVGGAVVPGL